MLKSTGVCADNSPPRIKPHLGNISKHSTESANNNRWAVFHEHESRSNFANDSGHFGPEAAFFAVDAPAFAGNRYVGARKSARNHVNNSSPRLSVKGSHVIPDGKRFQASVVLSRHKNAGGVGVVFDGTDGVPPKEFAPEYSATSACEKSQLIHATPPMKYSATFLPPRVSTVRS
jgi:hypothetical protein